MRDVSLTIGFLLVASTGFCQSASPWKMVDPPAFNLANIVVAKAKDANTLMVLVPQRAMETRTRTVPVTKTRSETRTKVVEVDGNAVEEAYTVEVPYIEEIEQTYGVCVLTGTVRKELPAGDLRAWGLDGKPLPAQQVLQKLQSPTHVYLLGQDQPLEISPYHAAVLNRNLMFLYHPEATPNRN